MTVTNKWYSYPRVMLLVYLLSSKSSYQKLVFFPQTLEKNRWILFRLTKERSQFSCSGLSPYNNRSDPGGCKLLIMFISGSG
jgi:hypothetical protein